MYLWLRSEVPLLIFILFNIVVTAITGYLTPRFITQFYNSLKNEEAFNHHFWLLAGLFSAEYANRFLFQLSTHRYIQVLLNQTRQRSFSLWLKAPFKKKAEGKHEEYPMGEVLARLMNDTDAVREIVSSGSFGIFIDIIFIISSLVSFLQLNSITGVSIFFAEIIAVLLLLKGSRAMTTIFMEVRKVTGHMARVVTDISSGLKELFFSPNEKYASRRGEKIFEEFLNKQLHANIWDAGYYSAAESLYPILIALVMVIVPYSNIVEVAILAALIDLIQRSITPIKDVASKISVISRARTGIERVHQFNESFEDEKSARMDFADLEVQELNFHLDTFKYEQGFSLSDISFQLKRGQVLGILGESGGGKSTLMKLLSGQYDTFKGEIRIDEKVIHPEEEQELRNFSSYVSLVAQDSHVFTDSLKFNITLGTDTGFEVFWEQALKAIPYLSRWELSPGNEISPKLLSLGQKQLVSGLRALFLQKPIILMDEISSGLDSELESALKDLITFFQSRCITIIVTHRLETIFNSDHLILLGAGKLLAQGSPALLCQNNRYKEFLTHLT
jgi:ABC-type multidrug transport system fused ATPase/permease subunit